MEGGLPWVALRSGVSGAMVAVVGVWLLGVGGRREIDTAGC